ncbi:MAG TPA: hypothetical protein VGS19_29985 [Streptosporangiaceae bacterium]|nr:hypothetical protein [Streptosporangiaceae bacterium]
MTNDRAPSAHHRGAAAAVHAQREETKGLMMTYEPRYLRFCRARFDRL